VVVKLFPPEILITPAVAVTLFPSWVCKVVTGFVDPVVAIVMLPAPFVTDMPVPAVMVAKTGSAPVDPIGNWPLVATPKEFIEPVELPSNRLWFVVPETFTVGFIVAVPVIVILLPPDTLVTVPLVAASA
jgi:hypothetical protein